MITDETYFPPDGTYVPFPGVFATWLGAAGEAPNPCVKYHVSSDAGCAGGVAAVVLPVLRELGVHHKVVRSRSLYARMQLGDQAGKFITVYTPAGMRRDRFVERVSDALSAGGDLRPSPRVPRARKYGHVFIERPLDEGMFIYGGFETDPSA